MRATRDHAVTVLLAVLLAAATPVMAGTVEGVFEVNNTLPDEASLIVAAFAEGADQPFVLQAVEPADGEIPYQLDDVEPGVYRIDLMASIGDIGLVLARLPGISVGEGSQSVPSAEAMGVDGGVSGTIELVGTPPADRLLLVRADRTDIEVEGMPDALNRLSFEVAKEDLAGGSIAYEFEGMSYGIYEIELIGYDYRTHQVEVYGELDRRLLIDATAPRASGADFTVELPAAAPAEG